MEPTEIKWRRERLELYEKLERSAENGLDREAVLASRELFDFERSYREQRHGADSSGDGFEGRFEPIHMVPVNVVLASSGAILVLFQCVQGEENQTEQKVKNAASHTELGVDLLRQAAQKTFPFVPKKSPSS
ncbi:hypothetical protein PI126_g7262, partial [Phytophthora idaei]